MPRVAVMAMTCALTLGGITALAFQQMGELASIEGEKLHMHRLLVEKVISSPKLVVGGRRVVFMGDSTTISKPGIPAWSMLVGNAIKRSGATPIYLIYPGQDLFHYYCLSGRVLDWKPDVVVIVVNQRGMKPGRRRGAEMNLCSYLPPSQLIRSLLLPYHDRGVSLVRLALIQALRSETVLDAMLFLEGTRRLVGDRWLEPSPKSHRRIPSVGVKEMFARDYQVRVSDDHPHVVVLRELVAELHREGTQVLVLFTPVPPAQLQLAEVGDRGFWQRTRNVYRRAVTEAGGEFVDLHGDIDASGFRDIADHLTASGHLRVFRAISPRVVRMLDLPQRAAVRGSSRRRTTGDP